MHPFGLNELNSPKAIKGFPAMAQHSVSGGMPVVLMINMCLIYFKLRIFV